MDMKDILLLTFFIGGCITAGMCIVSVSILLYHMVIGWIHRITKK